LPKRQSLPPFRSLDEVLIQFVPHFRPGMEDSRLYGCEEMPRPSAISFIERPSPVHIA